MKSWRPFQCQPAPDGAMLYHNNRYHVVVRKYPNPVEDGPDIIHLSIRDNERTVRHDWRDFQRIKNEICGPETEFVEVYPRESQLVDMSNQYHLFGFLTEEPLFTKAGLCWEQGRTVWDGISPRPLVPGHDVSDSMQRPIRSEG